MSPRPLRMRLLDLAVATVCVACVAAPTLPVVHAARSGSSIVESGATVDQRVLPTGVLSSPINGTFEKGTSGTLDGSVQWDMYSSAKNGMKLLISADRTPALRDAGSGTTVADYRATPSRWSVTGANRRFGFSVTGPASLSRFGEGAKWRGFDGSRAIEIARRSEVVPQTRTTVRLRAELGAPMATSARLTAGIRATAVTNL